MTLALAHRQELLPDAATLKTMLDMAGQLVQSGLLPASIKSPAAAMAIIQKGRELGIPPMYALSNISVINGKPVVGAEVMLAMIYRDHGDQAIQFEETSNQRCSAMYKRRSWTKARRFDWTMEDATKANLTGKGGVWNQYPAAMLRARCISALARLAFPDSIGGMYTAEELGADVQMTAEGEIEVVQPPAPVLKIAPADVVPPDELPVEPPGPSDAMRQHAIKRCKQLAEHAMHVGHPQAQEIASAVPESMNPRTLRTCVERLEALFPDVADPDEVAF